MTRLSVSRRTIGRLLRLCWKPPSFRITLPVRSPLDILAHIPTSNVMAESAKRAVRRLVDERGILKARAELSRLLIAQSQRTAAHEARKDEASNAFIPCAANQVTFENDANDLAKQIKTVSRALIDTKNDLSAFTEERNAVRGILESLHKNAKQLDQDSQEIIRSKRKYDEEMIAAIERCLKWIRAGAPSAQRPLHAVAFIEVFASRH